MLCGDCELAEGSIWEAFDKAGLLPASQPDRDRRRQPAGPARRRPTLGWDTGAYARGQRRSAARAIEIDGHDVDADRPRASPRRSRRPSGPADGDHRQARSRARASPRSRTRTAGTASRCPPTWRSGDRRAGRRAQSACRGHARGADRRSRRAAPAPQPAASDAELPRRLRGRREGRHRARPTATRWSRSAPATRASSRSTARSATRPTPTSSRRPTPSASSRCSSPSSRWSRPRSGCSVRGYVPFASTFAAFFTRAYDFIRMAAICAPTCACSGSHAGVEIGEDGPSQMALEDLAMMRAVHGSTVLYPCDANQTAALVAGDGGHARASATCAPRAGIPGDLRRRRAVPVGGSKVAALRAPTIASPWSAPASRCTRRCAAADMLAGEGIAARVIDLYSVKPIDAETLAGGRGDRRADRRGRGPLARGRARRGRARRAARRGPAEPAPHPAGGERDAGLGHRRELLDWAGIDGDHIAAAARTLVGA